MFLTGNHSRALRAIEVGSSEAMLYCTKVNVRIKSHHLGWYVKTTGNESIPSNNFIPKATQVRYSSWYFNSGGHIIKLEII